MIVIGYPAQQAAIGAINAAALARYVVAGFALLRMTGSPRVGHAIEFGQVVLDSLDRIRQRLPLTSPVDGAVDPDRLVLDRVGFSYGEGPEVLSDLDLNISAGEVVAVVGINGAGKTTLMKLLAGLDAPTRGRAQLWPRDQVAVLFQDFVRYPLPLVDNVTLASAGIGDALTAGRALELAGAAGLPDKLPQGLATPLSPAFAGGVDLSGGQWQKVALARAIHAVQHGRRLLIMDEPTAHLDAGQEAAFFDTVVRTLHGTTIILVSHRLSTVRAADRILLLDGGRVVEQGSHDELMAAGGRYAHMFALQAERFAEDGATAPEPAGSDSALAVVDHQEPR